jgi:hypothetical protein
MFPVRAPARPRPSFGLFGEGVTSSSTLPLGRYPGHRPNAHTLAWAPISRPGSFAECWLLPDRSALSPPGACSFLLHTMLIVLVDILIHPRDPGVFKYLKPNSVTLTTNGLPQRISG